MLSEAHHASALSNWFTEFKRIFGDTPDVFVCDISFALLNAAAYAFASCSDIWVYIEKLFQMHSSDEINDIPKTSIRIDRTHLINNVSKCVALKASSFIVRNFYIRSVCLMLQATNLKQAELILMSILVVAYSKNEGKMTFLNSFCVCFYCYTFLFPIST